MKTSFYTEEELRDLGLKRFGSKVLISRYCRIYNPQDIEIGDNVRIDDFCILSGHIKIGSNIHIASFCNLVGGGGIILDDYIGISSRTACYSATDDYSGDFLVGPVFRAEARHVIAGLVHLHKYVVIGTNSTIFPNVDIGEGVAVGAMSLVNKSLQPWGIYVGVPCKFMKARSKKLLDLI